jgi:hypothetical protein
MDRRAIASLGRRTMNGQTEERRGKREEERTEFTENLLAKFS